MPKNHQPPKHTKRVDFAGPTDLLLNTFRAAMADDAPAEVTFNWLQVFTQNYGGLAKKQPRSWLKKR